MTTYTATDAQYKFIGTLIAERDVRPTDATDIQGMINTRTLMKDAASALIDTLKKLAYKPKPNTENDTLLKELATIPKSKYAIPFREVAAAGIQIDAGRNDYLFLEVKLLPAYGRSRQARLVMNRLHGHPGAFSRSGVHILAKFKLIKLIREGIPLTYARNFADVYKVCGCCAAELTDPLSRELKLGPECRKRFNL